MGAVTIRKINDELKQAMREAAAANGRSVEAELRDLLKKTYGKAKKLPQNEKSIGEALYESSRPGFDFPETLDNPASYADFQE